MLVVYEGSKTRDNLWLPGFVKNHTEFRLACPCITEGTQSIPAAAMETILNLPSLDILIMEEARMKAYLLSNTNNWRTPHRSGHTSIETVVINPIFDMGSDIVTIRISNEKLYKVFLNRDEWRHGEGRKLKIQNWYTGRTRASDNSGIGVYEEN